MTYRELRDKIGEFSDEQLGCDVIVEDGLNDECYQADLRFVGPDHRSLDENHPVIYF